MKKNLKIYLLAALAVFAVKIFYRTADSEQLMDFGAHDRVGAAFERYLL